MRFATAKHKHGDVTGARAVYREMLAVSNNGERAAWNLACLAAGLPSIASPTTPGPAELGMGDDASACARAAMAQRDPTVYAYGRGRLTPVHVLKKVPVYDELMREVNWPTDVDIR